MRRINALGAIAIVAAALAACSAQTPIARPSTPPPRTIPTAWELVTDQGVSLFSWTVAKDGTVTGADEQTGADSNWNVTTKSFPVSGKIADGGIALTVGGSGVLGGGATVTGTITPFTLTLSGVANGAPQTWTLFPSAQAAYQRDVGTFTTQMQNAQQVSLDLQSQDMFNQAVATFRQSVTDLRTAMTTQKTSASAEQTALATYQKAVSSAKARGCFDGPGSKAVDRAYSALNQAIVDLENADAELQRASVDVTTARGSQEFDTEGLDIAGELDEGDSLRAQANQIVSGTQKTLATDSATQSDLYAKSLSMPSC